VTISSKAIEEQRRIFGEELLRRLDA